MFTSSSSRPLTLSHRYRLTSQPVFHSLWLFELVCVCSCCKWLLLHQRQTCWKFSDQRYAASNNQQRVSQNCEQPGSSPVWSDLFLVFVVFVTGRSGEKPVDFAAAGWTLNTTDLFFGLWTNRRMFTWRLCRPITNWSGAQEDAECFILQQLFRATESTRDCFVYKSAFLVVNGW